MLEALGNIGDFVGGVAVVLTLIYLAVQVRQNTRQMRLNTAAVRSAAYGAQLETTRLANMEIVRDRQLAEWTMMSEEALQRLDAVDRMRFDVFFTGALRQRQHLFLEARDGLIRSELTASHDEGLRQLFLNPGVRDLWARSKANFARDFVDHVESLLSRTAGGP